MFYHCLIVRCAFIECKIILFGSTGVQGNQSLPLLASRKLFAEGVSRMLRSAKKTKCAQREMKGWSLCVGYVSSRSWPVFGQGEKSQVNCLIS